MRNYNVCIASIILVLGLIGAYFSEIYKYEDCKKVGHKTLYCILDILR